MTKDVFLFKLEKVGFDFSKADIPKSLISRKIKEFNLDLNQLRLNHKSKVEKHRTMYLDNPEYDLIFSFRNNILDFKHTSLLYEKVLKDSKSVLDFLYEFKKNKDLIKEIDFLILSEKIKTYSIILDFYCKNEIRSKSKSIQFDKKLNEILKKKEQEIKWVNEEFNFLYSDLSDSYSFIKDDFQYEVKLIPLFFILKDLLHEKDEDLYPYYLALLNSKDSDKIRSFWAFSQMMKTIKTKKIK